MRKTKVNIRITRYIICIILAIIILNSTVLNHSDNIDFSQKLHHKLGIDTKYPISKEISRQIAEYLDEDGIKEPKITMFNERENKHMQDVKELLDKIDTITAILLIILICLMISEIYNLRNRKEFKERIYSIFKCFINTTIIMIIILIMIGTLFSSFFSLLHIILFEPGTYSFNPDTEIMINIFPPEFFFLAAKTIIIELSVIFVALKILIFTVEKYFVNKE